MRLGVIDLEKVIEQLKSSNESLRQERNEALDQLNELNQYCGQLASEKQSLLDEVEQMKMENKQLQQQRLNDWKLRKAAEEKLIKLTAKLSRDKHSTSKTQDHHTEVKDVTSNLHVTGSSLGTDVKDREESCQKEHEGHTTVESRDENSPCFHGNSSLVPGHVTTAESHLTVTSETVTSLPETLRRIRREKSSISGAAMLAATYPPRPNAAGHQVIGHEVTELGQSCLAVSQAPFKSTLHLPRIPHRHSSY